MTKLDEKDKAILEALQEDASRSTQEIARHIRLPITTVHNRIKKLRQEGTIRSYTIALDHKKLGKEIGVYTFVIADYGYLKRSGATLNDLAQRIRKHPWVEQTAVVTGEIDILVKFRVENITQLEEFTTRYLKNMEGIERTRSMVIMNEG